MIEHARCQDARTSCCRVSCRCARHVPHERGVARQRREASPSRPPTAGVVKARVIDRTAVHRRHRGSAQDGASDGHPTGPARHHAAVERRPGSRRQEESGHRKRNRPVVDQQRSHNERLHCRRIGVAVQRSRRCLPGRRQPRSPPPTPTLASDRIDGPDRRPRRSSPLRRLISSPNISRCNYFRVCASSAPSRAGGGPAGMMLSWLLACRRARKGWRSGRFTPGSPASQHRSMPV